MAELNFHPAIYQEIQDAYSWYEHQATGLGEDFLGELESACESIRSLPETRPIFGKRTRRSLLEKFPYPVVLPDFQFNMLCRCGDASKPQVGLQEGSSVIS